MNAIDGPFKELSDTEYAKFRKELLRVKGSERQREFLGIVRDTDAFLDHVSAIATEGTVDAALATEPMTESEYKDPPPDTEQALYVAWSSLAPAVACRSTFWANLTIEHIRAGRIQSAYLAANGGNLPGGAERIDFALDEEKGQGPKQIDECVRTVLRRLGGLRRGAREPLDIRRLPVRSCVVARTLRNPGRKRRPTDRIQRAGRPPHESDVLGEADRPDRVQKLDLRLREYSQRHSQSARPVRAGESDVESDKLDGPAATLPARHDVSGRSGTQHSEPTANSTP